MTDSYPNLSLRANATRQFISINAIKIAVETLGRLLKKVRKEKLTAEVFGGIEFVQVCFLPSSQKKLFWQSPVSKKIITILRGKELLFECLVYKDYCDWYINLEKKAGGQLA
jgi:hypothetical protein